jgi:hypothetical protein
VGENVSIVSAAVQLFVHCGKLQDGNSRNSVGNKQIPSNPRHSLERSWWLVTSCTRAQPPFGGDTTVLFNLARLSAPAVRFHDTQHSRLAPISFRSYRPRVLRDDVACDRTLEGIFKSRLLLTIGGDASGECFWRRLTPLCSN